MLSQRSTRTGLQQVRIGSSGDSSCFAGPRPDFLRFRYCVRFNVEHFPSAKLAQESGQIDCHLSSRNCKIISWHEAAHVRPFSNQSLCAAVLYTFFGLRLLYIAWRSKSGAAPVNEEIEEVSPAGPSIALLPIPLACLVTRGAHVGSAVWQQALVMNMLSHR